MIVLGFVVVVLCCAGFFLAEAVYGVWPSPEFRNAGARDAMPRLRDRGSSIPLSAYQM
jgi:hypothetical protein